MGAEQKSQFIDQKEKLATAYHEVQVLVQALLTVWVFRVDMPSCVPRSHALDYVCISFGAVEMPSTKEYFTYYKLEPCVRRYKICITRLTLRYATLLKAPYTCTCWLHETNIIEGLSVWCWNDLPKSSLLMVDPSVLSGIVSVCPSSTITRAKGRFDRWTMK